jgi:hypothetical protein
MCATRFGFHTNVTVMVEHLPVDMAGDFHDRFVARPLSASSVIRVCRLSCQRPFTIAFLRTFFQAVFNEVTCRVGSDGMGLPKGKRYHSSCVAPKRS